MSIRPVSDSTIYRFPHAFISKKGEPIVVTLLDEPRRHRLIEMYLAFQPRPSFSGLPPADDQACTKWVESMIGRAINLVALSFDKGVVAHEALFPMEGQTCEMLDVVAASVQDCGIGSELARCGMQLAYELGFEKVLVSIEVANARARHVYRKCGFEDASEGDPEDMVLDLRAHRRAMSVCAADIMNARAVTIHPDQPCRQALETFVTRHVGTLPVVDGERRLVGILSTSDLLLPSKLAKRVRDVFTRQVVSVREDVLVAKVVRLLQSTGLRCIPVVDREMKLVGVIGRQDVLAYYAGQDRPRPAAPATGLAPQEPPSAPGTQR
ncbi:MAG: Carnitine transport ATP-binding protein OpuCA [Planctomycetes bacterium ADurb.Bin126]|nr:MAG: Carnitine transport ATP-binding protein OpuCA [Planctomycetes bacterium ADurb.Bin126]HOD84417.1 GNAT family N-acetyltransferase [Phycisphaerae bacterium]HQL73859.1 GNAT family N-acetyltransferase [Phycisphaerae bacterium]